MSDASSRTVQEKERGLRERLGTALEDHISLRDKLPFGVGGVTNFFVTTDTIDALIKTVTAARAEEVPWIVVGTGSQTILSDYGFSGLVIHNIASQMTFVPDKGQVLVETGARWPALVLAAAGRELGGLEPLLAAPGTIGGALSYQRISEGVRIPSVVRQVTILTIAGEIHQIPPKDLSHYEKATLLVATLQLVHTRRDEIARRIAQAEKTRRHYQEQRWLGPIFFSDFALADPSYLPDKFERTKVLGMKVGGAVFSEMRPNYIEARGRVTAEEVRELVTVIYDRLQTVVTEPLTVHLKFFGTWAETRTDTEN